MLAEDITKYKHPQFFFFSVSLLKIITSLICHFGVYLFLKIFLVLFGFPIIEIRNPLLKYIVVNSERYIRP